MEAVVEAAVAEGGGEEVAWVGWGAVPGVEEAGDLADCDFGGGCGVGEDAEEGCDAEEEDLVEMHDEFIY